MSLELKLNNDRPFHAFKYINEGNADLTTLPCFTKIIAIRLRHIRSGGNTLKFDVLRSGRFLRRYKRFLADIELSNGDVLTVHCPNTGAMTGCLQKGSLAYFSESTNKARKYPHTLEWFELSNNAKACINTQLPNKLIHEAIANGVISELQDYNKILTEQKYGGENSRIDLLLSDHKAGQPDCYVEVKNVTLCEGSCGYFPDAISLRALKHIRELILMIESGYRAALVFCINHTDIEVLKPADKVHLDYGRLLREAASSGLELYAYRTQISPEEITVERSIPVDLSE